jgi:SAM-dependent methyltransferase
MLRKLARAILSGDSEAFQNRLTGKPTREVFETIYRKRMWGGRLTREAFYSGSGSRDHLIVGPYVNAVRDYISTNWRDRKPVVVDIGCGDFSVGRQLTDLAYRYVACDIVQSLIDHNAEAFAATGAEFRVVDAIDDPLPVGDIALLRQVLQHLSNGQIAKVAAKLSRFKAAIVTEHLPAGGNFIPNLDAPTGLDTRLRTGSGVVLTAPPFNFAPRNSRVICEVAEHGGLIRSVAYEF